MQPDFGQAHAKLTCEIDRCCLRARFGSCSGFLSPPAPRGADGPGHSFVCWCFYVTAIHPLFPSGRRYAGLFLRGGHMSEISGRRSDDALKPQRHLISISAAPRRMPGLSWLPSCTMTAAASMPSALICAMGTFQFDWAALSEPSLSQLRTTLW